MCDFSVRGAHPLATGKEGWVRTRRGAASQPGLDGLALRYVSLSRTDSALTTPCLTVEGGGSLTSTGGLCGLPRSLSGRKAVSPLPSVGCGPLGALDCDMLALTPGG